MDPRNMKNLAEATLRRTLHRLYDDRERLQDEIKIMTITNVEYLLDRLETLAGIGDTIETTETLYRLMVRKEN